MLWKGTVEGRVELACCGGPAASRQQGGGCERASAAKFALVMRQGMVLRQRTGRPRGGPCAARLRRSQRCAARPPLPPGASRTLRPHAARAVRRSRALGRAADALRLRAVPAPGPMQSPCRARATGGSTLERPAQAAATPAGSLAAARMRPGAVHAEGRARMCRNTGSVAVMCSRHRPPGVSAH